MTLYEPKVDLQKLLSEVEYSIGEVEVLQRSQDELPAIPCIVFNVSNNSATLELSKDIAFQKIEVTIDFFGNDDSETTAMLQEAEEELRSNGYVMTFCSDVPDPDGYSHISTRFNFTK
jgi:hypothetical protein